MLRQSYVIATLMCFVLATEGRAGTIKLTVSDQDTIERAKLFFREGAIYASMHFGFFKFVEDSASRVFKIPEAGGSKCYEERSKEASSNNSRRMCIHINKASAQSIIYESDAEFRSNGVISYTLKEKLRIEFDAKQCKASWISLEEKGIETAKSITKNSRLSCVISK